MAPGCPLDKVKLSAEALRLCTPVTSVGLTLGHSALLWVSGRCTLELFLYQPLTGCSLASPRLTAPNFNISVSFSVCLLSHSAQM